ncbi:uncharacterized protein E0L32_011871 [Thyridium curvatum]|uniref:Uncharacterized protein n=1 Tax=Thyridium curvatum TaxID=1093900 RepID=A0A507B6X4_9PEZI|nr:uncharacterized protein E0L32_011871 [Thyridium curvatum]TPX18052.1 hypothetical protein E0L32_011871 [Thyridium curvatum]
MGLFNSSISFNAQNDIPSLEGKVILVTGGNNGLGRQSVLEYARHSPARIWLTSRSLDKGRAAADDIRKEMPGAPIEILELDLASFDSIKKAASTVRAQSDRLDILLLNAGIMASAPALTEDGYELQFGTNYVGHALLTKLLTPLLESTAALPGADVRIVSVSSDGHAFAPKGGFFPETCKTTAEEMGPFGRYGQSKMAGILWGRELARRYPQFTVASVHPGVVKTGLGTSWTGAPRALYWLLTAVATFAAKTPEQGAKNQLWASMAKDIKSGEYYEPVGIPDKASEDAKNEELAKKVWDWTAKELEGCNP